MTGAMNYKVENVSKYKGETVQVDFDCREPVFINSSVAYDLGIKAGKIMSDGDISEALSKNDFRRARERALYLLDERDYGYAEMFKKLESSYPEDICYSVVNNLSELGLIDDRRYAEKCAEYYLVTKMRGKYRAREEMRKRGIPRELIDEALDEYEDGAQDRLKELIERKYLRKLSEENGPKKVKAALARQGYGFDDINAALREFEEFED